jgi:hypothetical protein
MRALCGQGPYEEDENKEVRSDCEGNLSKKKIRDALFRPQHDESKFTRAITRHQCWKDTVKI